MIVFLRFKNIGEYEMGPPQTNVWPFIFGNHELLPPGPKFAKADWFSDINLSPATEYDKTNKLFGNVKHRPETIDLDLPIKKQLRRINGTLVVMLLFPIHVIDLKDDNNTLSKIIKTFEPFPEVKFMFSQTWDMVSPVLNDFNAVDYILDSVKDIDSHRLNFYLCNPYTIDEIKSKRPDVDARVMAIYFNRIKHFNREEVTHNPELRSKHFLCLNNFVKYHRTFIVDRMPPDHSYVSYVEKGKKLSLDKKLMFFSQTLTQDLSLWQDCLPYFYWQDSYINIVTETMHERAGIIDNHNDRDDYTLPELPEGSPLLKGPWSEKSVKPIYFRQMFLIVGVLGANKTLQDLGFKLFDNFIDYSFDLEEDPLLRLKQVYVEIKRLTDISIEDIHAYYNSAECQDIIEHNLAVYKTYCYIPTEELMVKYQTTTEPKLTLSGWTD